jgi:superfamily I DNA and/or RNA helicase
LSDLENDPDSIRSALAEYTVVLAATCQQADSKEIWAAKNDSPVFETVIIDEAARANPLDLLIPMSMAKRRIVLVGDHRQLPQILDEEVQRAVQSDRSNPDLDPLRESLFERLFRNLKEREARDGVKRTVTLDKQYRMHPKLGSFVSRCFYEAFGDPKIDSGKDDNEFLHALPGYVGRVAAWLSVPEGRGREKHAGHSWARQSEAEAVAKELARLIEASPDMSIGIISFYGAQIAEIWRQLEQLGLAIRDADGYRIIQKYRYATDHMGRQAERVQIGTVDSFQGKEFDVVILSLTRCNSHKPSADEEALRRKYGFLTLINRLCVAMSRQRRLLIVAGDEKMAEDIPDGVPSLAPLREFLAMTRSDDGRI